MKQTLALLLLLTLGCNSNPTPPIAINASTNNQHPTPSHQALGTSSTSNQQLSPGNQPFDYYLLNLSWSPEFCLSHPNSAANAECTQHLAFILHGLWPQRNDQGPRGPFLEDCTTDPGPADPSKFADLYPDPPLLAHEWKTHGTCSGLAPDAYFSLARTVAHSVAIPDTIAKLDHQISLPPDEILGLFRTANPTFPAGAFALSCGNNYLTAIEACINKSGQPTSCPATLRSCRANTVRIPPP